LYDLLRLALSNIIYADAPHLHVMIQQEIKKTESKGNSMQAN